MILIKGHAYEWYKELYFKCLKTGIRQCNNQGVNYELPSPVHITIPSEKNVYNAMLSATTHRRNNLENRLQFSILHGIQKLIGLPESYLSKRYPILTKYINPHDEALFERSYQFIREPLLNDNLHEADWITSIKNENGAYDVIDQLHLAIHRITTSDNFSTRRAYIDFNEGYKPRCVSSWHFLVRNNKLELHQNSRSTDMLVGMPNDLLAARFTQIILSILLGLEIGELHHQATVVQVYAPDIANIDGIKAIDDLTSNDEIIALANKFYNDSSLLAESFNSIKNISFDNENLKENIFILRRNMKDTLDGFLN